MIRYIYTFFVGLFLAIFIGLGIAVFYEAPTPPGEPSWYGSIVEKKELTSTERQEEQRFIAAQKEYDQQLQAYNRNVSLIVLVCAVIVLVFSLLFAEKLGTIADGLLLGGIFTLLYGIISGIATDNNKYRFLIVSIGLAVTLALGYFKFIRGSTSQTKNR